MTEAAISEPELTAEEEELRARVYTNKARQAVESYVPSPFPWVPSAELTGRHDYRLAKALYEKASEHQPGNERLSLRCVPRTINVNTEEGNSDADESRITEMSMLMEGHLSRPDVGSTSILTAPVKRQRALEPITESGMGYDGTKRLRFDE